MAVFILFSKFILMSIRQCYLHLANSCSILQTVSGCFSVVVSVRELNFTFPCEDKMYGSVSQFLKVLFVFFN